MGTAERDPIPGVNRYEFPLRDRNIDFQVEGRPPLHQLLAALLQDGDD
jgi:hypothetical protein